MPLREAERARRAPIGRPTSRGGGGGWACGGRRARGTPFRHSGSGAAEVYDVPVFSAIMSYGRGNNECRIYVGNLPPDIRTKDIEDLFYKFGKIVFIDLKNRRGPPFAFVEFEDSRWVAPPSAPRPARTPRGGPSAGRPPRPEWRARAPQALECWDPSALHDILGAREALGGPGGPGGPGRSGRVGAPGRRREKAGAEPARATCACLRACQLAWRAASRPCAWRRWLEGGRGGHEWASGGHGGTGGRRAGGREGTGGRAANPERRT